MKDKRIPLDAMKELNRLDTSQLRRDTIRTFTHFEFMPRNTWANHVLIEKTIISKGEKDSVNYTFYNKVRKIEYTRDGTIYDVMDSSVVRAKSLNEVTYVAQKRRVYYCTTHNPRHKAHNQEEIDSISAKEKCKSLWDISWEND